MGQQSNKVQKRRRRLNYNKRKKLLTKTNAVTAKTAAPAKTPDAPAKKAVPAKPATAPATA
jgi:hypothetical protein